MIKISERTFQLDTKDTSYIFAVTAQGHLEHIYYGSKLPQADTEALRLKNT